MATKRPTEIVIGSIAHPVRFSYANVFAPRASEEGAEPKYSLTLLVPKDHPDTEAIFAAHDAAVKEGMEKFWSGKKPNFKNEKIKDGDEDYPDKPECEGMYVISTNCKADRKPGVIDENKNPFLDESEFYSGCWGRVNVNFFAYNNPKNKGIGCGLNFVQKLRDGEAFSGTPRTAAQAFGEDEEGMD